MTNATAKMNKNTNVDSAEAELKCPWRISSTTNWLIVAVGAFELADTKITGKSYIRKASNVRNSTATISAGFTKGKVIDRNICHVDAPSTRAASYTPRGIICKPAKISKAIKGVVFHTSATITAVRAAHGSVVHPMFVPSRAFTMPRGAKMNCHSFAVTAVGIAHGTNTAALNKPRPRNSLFITVAIQKPNTVSNATVTTAKKIVIRTAGQKSEAITPDGQVPTSPLAVIHR